MQSLNLPHDHGRINGSIGPVPSDDDFSEAAGVFRQLGDSSRLRIFWLLCHSEECVTNISALVGMSSPAVSHHLRQLRSAGLIESRRAGKEVYYRAASTPASETLHSALESIMCITCPAQCMGKSSE